MRDGEGNYRFHPVRKGQRIIGMVIFGLATAAIFGLIFGYFVELLWNWLMPTVFKLGLINYWQGFGIVILARLIFGGFGHDQHERHDHSQYWRRHAEHVHDRSHDRDRYYNRWQYREYYDRWWHEAGKDAFEEYIAKHEHNEENH
jgi:hypothetical protein